MVLFQMPNCCTQKGVEMGLVISVWRGIKAPKLFSGSTNVSSCVAFRVVVLDMEENSDAPLCSGNVVTP